MVNESECDEVRPSRSSRFALYRRDDRSRVEAVTVSDLTSESANLHVLNCQLTYGQADSDRARRPNEATEE